MRILRLDLRAFGPFTNAVLDFRTPDKPLHLIYGANEAGKSSCLRALRGWLYEIPTQTNDNFIHAYSDMRIGGMLESHSGEKLEFVRRKGKQKTLLSIDEAQVIDDSKLRQFLGGVDQNTFTTRFALDYLELQAGGDQIAQGSGDLAEILFAAGAGVTRLKEVQKGLADEIQSLFKSRGSNAAINSSLHSLKESRKRISELSLATSDWERHCLALKQAEDRLEVIASTLKMNRTSHGRFSRLMKALPLFNRMSLAIELLKEVKDAPLLPADFGVRRAQAIERRSDAEQRVHDAGIQIGRLQSLLEKVAQPREFLVHRSLITSLHTELGSYQKAAKDRPKLIAELTALKSQANKLCARIGWETDLEKAAAYKLPISRRKRIDALASESVTMLVQQEELQRSESKIRRALAALHAEQPNSEQSAQPGMPDMEGLRKSYRAALPHADAEQELEQLSRRADSIEREMATHLARLPQFQGNIEQLTELPVPLKETVQKFEREFQGLQEKILRREERIKEFENQVSHLDRKIERLQLEHDVPTELDLQVARDRRESGWQLLRRRLSGETFSQSEDSGVDQFIASWPGSSDLLQAFHTSVQHADSVADRLRREAVRVSEKSNWTAERNELLNKLATEENALNHAQDELKILNQQWKDGWRESAIDPLSPDEMLAWIQARDQLSMLNRDYRQAVQDSIAVQERIALHIQAISDQMSTLGCTSVGTTTSLSQTIELCESSLKELDATSRDFEVRSQQLKKLTRDLSETLEEKQNCEVKMRQWALAWQEAVSWLGLTDRVRPDEAQEILREIDQLASTLGEIESIQHRVAGIDRDASEFSDRARSLLSATCQNHDLPIDQAVSDLHQRLQEAIETQTKIEEWQEQLDMQQTLREKANRELLHWSRQIESLCSMAGRSDIVELEDAEQRSLQRLQHEKEIHDFRDALAELAGSENLEEFLNAVEQSDLDQLSAELQQLEEQISQQEREQHEAAQEVGARRAELKRMDGGSLAAQAQEDAEHHLASIRSGAEQYIRLRLAEMLLKASIERFRDANQGPVLSRASELFRELTLGSFSGLRADFNDQGNAVLLGVRANGKSSVAISGMSTGTCDQLYLALRLAMIESYALEHEPIPFIVDDVLIQFDDHRSAAALGLLSGLAEKTQVIYFTHHHRIVELAQQNLSPEHCVVHRLG